VHFGNFHNFQVPPPFIPGLEVTALMSTVPKNAQTHTCICVEMSSIVYSVLFSRWNAAGRVIEANDRSFEASPPVHPVLGSNGTLVTGAPKRKNAYLHMR
jgi:hypothetical protein